MIKLAELDVKEYPSAQKQDVFHLPNHVKELTQVLNKRIPSRIGFYADQAEQIKKQAELLKVRQNQLNSLFEYQEKKQEIARHLWRCALLLQEQFNQE